MKYQCRLKIIFAEEKSKNRKFTQKGFAKKIGLSETSLSQISNGLTLPSFDVVYRILMELKRPIEDVWIFVEDETKIDPEKES